MWSLGQAWQMTALAASRSVEHPFLARQASVRLTDEVDLFLRRATDEGLLRSDLPPGWVGKLLPPLMRNAADELPELSAAQAADVVVETLLRGVGASQPGPERRAGL
jgi:hypothetical protein